MPDTDSIVIAKTFDYRGAPEVWTNKYHLEGTTPTTRAEALALFRAIWESERPIYSSQVKLAGGSFYKAGNEAAAFMFDATNIGGTAALNTGNNANSADATPGDTAIWVRWGTTERNSKNKPIYLRKYFHGFALASTGDSPNASVEAPLLAHGAKMYDGSLPGGMKICGPQGADAISHQKAQFVTTRTLKRNARTPT